MNLSEIEKALEAATPAPWQHYGDGDHEVFCSTNFEDADYEPPAVTFGSERFEDARAICLLRNEVPKLIERIRELESANRVLYNDEIRNQAIDFKRELVLLAEDQAHMEAERDRLRAALRAVEKLHHPIPGRPTVDGNSPPSCSCGHWQAPCPTHKALALTSPEVASTSVEDEVAGIDLTEGSGA